MAEAHRNETASDSGGVDRRTVLTGASGLAMAAGLIAGYGAFGAAAAQYLYPSEPAKKRWLFVVESARMKSGDSMVFRAPDGASVAIARQAESGNVTDFLALSSVCPHLGCQVHWEGAANRFFCPCHNGTFDPSGRATGGPPGEAGQSLLRYPLKLENGLLFVEVPDVKLAAADSVKPNSGEVC